MFYSVEKKYIIFIFERMRVEVLFNIFFIKSWVLVKDLDERRVFVDLFLMFLFFIDLFLRFFILTFCLIVLFIIKILKRKGER